MTFIVTLPPHSEWKSWRARIRHFTWAWHTTIMGTGAISALLHNFPYHNDSLALKIAALMIFLLNLVLFCFVCTCTILRYSLYPELWSRTITHPAQGLFIGCFPMGIATLISTALAVNQYWGTGGNGLVYVLWVLWWVDSVVSYAIAFGMLYVMMVKQNHVISRMSAIWLLPVVTLVVASSTGGLLGNVLREHSHTLALVTTGFSFTMVVIGLAFALMIMTVYFLRLIIHGPPDARFILSAFMVLGPLGQGGYSLLLNGQNLSLLLPLSIGSNFPQSEFAGQMVFASCFVGAYVLWSMGIAWILLACCSIAHVIRISEVPFSLAYWGLIFPNAVFALCSVQLAKVLDSGFFRAFGAAWSCLVFVLWSAVFLRSIPAFIDGSMFQALGVDDLPLTHDDLDDAARDEDEIERSMDGMSATSTLRLHIQAKTS